MHDPLIVPIPFKHLFTESEEGISRRTVVLDDDGFLDVLKHPTKPRCHTSAASKVRISEIVQDIARPVYMLNNLTSLSA